MPTPTATPTVTPTPSPVQAPRYNGPLFDTHLHLSLGRLQSVFSSANDLLRYLDKNGERGAIGFYVLPPSASAPSAVRALPFVRGASPRVVPLLQPWGTGAPILGALARGEYTEAVLRGYLVPNGPFQGVGEIPLYTPDMQAVTFESPQVQTVLRVVNEMNGIVMIHPSEGPLFGRTMELAEIEPSIRQYSDTTFLFHTGPPIFDRLVLPLLSRYSNVYFTMDVNIWLFRVDGRSLMEPGGVFGAGGSAEVFLAEVEGAGRDQLLEVGLRKSLGRLRQHPDRILWGTDRGIPWHFEERVTELIIEMSRQFIARMPSGMQEDYAFRNALRVFGRYLSPSP